jgi:hypothetical protein
MGARMQLICDARGCKAETSISLGNNAEAVAADLRGPWTKGWSANIEGDTFCPDHYGPEQSLIGADDFAQALEGYA